MFSTFQARISERFLKMNYASSFPSPTTHEEALFYNCKKSAWWKRHKYWVPRDMGAGPGLKGRIGLIFWRGAHSHVS